MKNYPCPAFLGTARLVCLKIATTGPKPVWNNIIELGVVEVRNGEIARQYSRLFGGGRSPVHQVRNVHGIRDSERVGQSTFARCAGKVGAYLSGAVLLTHDGTGFDIPFLEAKMREAGVPLSCRRHIDTRLIAGKLGYSSLSLEALCGLYGIPCGGADRRERTDCLCTLQLLYAFAKEFGEEKVLV